MRRVRRFTTILAVWSLAAAACTGGESATTTVAPPPTMPVATTTSTTMRVTTTTLPYAVVDVTVEGDDSAGEVVSGLYTWLADRAAPQPDLPEGLVEHLTRRRPQEEGPLTGELFSDGVIDMGTAGVVMVENEDVILLVDEGDGWRVVGAWFARYGFEPWFGDPIRYVFVIGTDARDWEDQEHLRGDSLHILSSNVAEHAGAILGIPRDTWVEAPYGMDKFTNVNALVWTRSEETIPGQDVMVEIARDLSGLPIEGFIITGFRDFQLLLNNYGGLEVDIPLAMADSSSGAFFKAGVQYLWGRLALAFSRNRHIPGGDFTRSFNQGLVILGKLRATLETDFSRLPWWVSALAAHTWTDLSFEDLVTLAAGAYLLDPDKVGNAVLPGRVATRGGASVVILSDSAEELFRDLDDGALGSDVAGDEARSQVSPR